MNRKAFTLIELLVVVAIIGILAAVGVVAYNGYTLGVKKAATKQQYRTFVKFFQAELYKCYMGESHIRLMYKQEDPTYYDYSCANPGGAQTTTLMDYIQIHFKNSGGGSKGGKSKGIGWVNPFSEGGKCSWCPGNAFDDGPKGQILVEHKVESPYNKIIISTQYDDSHEPRFCTKNCVKLTSEIYDER